MRKIRAGDRSLTRRSGLASSQGSHVNAASTGNKWTMAACQQILSIPSGVAVWLQSGGRWVGGRTSRRRDGGGWPLQLENVVENQYGWVRAKTLDGGVWTTGEARHGTPWHNEEKKRRCSPCSLLGAATHLCASGIPPSHAHRRRSRLASRSRGSHIEGWQVFGGRPVLTDIFVSVSLIFSTDQQLPAER